MWRYGQAGRRGRDCHVGSAAGSAPGHRRGRAARSRSDWAATASLHGSSPRRDVGGVLAGVVTVAAVIVTFMVFWDFSRTEYESSHWHDEGRTHGAGPWTADGTLFF